MDVLEMRPAMDHFVFPKPGTPFDSQSPSVHIWDSEAFWPACDQAFPRPRETLASLGCRHGSAGLLVACWWLLRQGLTWLWQLMTSVSAWHTCPIPVTPPEISAPNCPCVPLVRDAFAVVALAQSD